MECCAKTHPHMHHSHKDHSRAHSMDHGSASVYLKRFWIVTLLLIPLIVPRPAILEFFGLYSFGLNKWIQFGVATIIFGFALIFFQHAWHEIRSSQYGMMTLVSLAVGAGYVFSVISTFIPALHTEFYLEISTLIWVLLFGHYLEAKSSTAAGNALQEVAKLLPKSAHKIIDGKEFDVDVSNLLENDIVIVKPGEKIPADGIIIKGSAGLDETLVSGESRPIEKKDGMGVVAGSICLDGSLTIKLVRVGDKSTVGQIKKLIEQASRTKPRSQKIADKAAAVLTFVAFITAIATLLIWIFVVGQTFVFSITLAITVLVIACPHALGLAIPTITTTAISLALKNGFFIKDLSKIEIIRKVNYIVFDKTGTLTKGQFGITGIEVIGGKDEEEVLRVAASLEQYSSHVIGLSILNHARSKNIGLLEISEFRNIAGHGVRASIDRQEYFVGNAQLIQNLNLNYQFSEEISDTIVFVANSKELLGYITLADAVKKSAYESVASLRLMGIKVAMLTGDSDQVAKSVSKKLGIDTYFANVLPEEKYKYIKELQKKGNIVLMVGDGINDAPALTQSDVGVAIGAGTDLAIESGDIILTSSDPLGIVRLLFLSKKVYAKMIQNLVWALGYNIVAIPMAAGVFATWGFFLRPEIGALIMSLSTVVVVINALSLKRATFR